jgi:hypothetical protein
VTQFNRISVVLAATLLTSAGLSAQSVISAKSGIVHYVEGDVFLGDKPVTPTFGQFPDIKEGDQLRTGEGRAEVLLTPGVFLRMAENSAIRMISNRLIDTRVEVLKGSVLIECAEVMKDNTNTFAMGDATFEIRKKGLLRLDADATLASVYAGEALVSRGTDTLTLKEGRQTTLAGVLSPERFDNKTGDAFYRWASRRAGYLSVANVSAAKSLLDSGTRLQSSGWGFNPLLGVYTFIPMGRYYASPFGYRFYGLGDIAGYYDNFMPVYRQPASSWNTNQGMDNSPHYNAELGYSTAPRSSPAYSSPAPSAAPSGAAVPSGTSGRSSGDSGAGRSSGTHGR